MPNGGVAIPGRIRKRVAIGPDFVTGHHRSHKDPEINTGIPKTHLLVIIRVWRGVVCPASA